MINKEKVISAAIKISNCIIKILKKEFTEKKKDDSKSENDNGDSKPVLD